MHSHSFSEQFYCPDGADPYDPNTWELEHAEPKTLIAAIARLEKEDPESFNTACEAANIYPKDECVHWELLHFARETVNAVDDYRSPIRVYLSEDFHHYVEVFC